MTLLLLMMLREADHFLREQEVRVSQLFNTLLFTQQQKEEQEVRVSQLFNTLLFTQQQEEEQEVRVSQLFNTSNMEDYPEWLIILLGMLVKHLIRRLFSASSRLHSQELSNRLMFLTEHVVFSCWAYYCVYHVPETTSVGSSW